MRLIPVAAFAVIAAALTIPTPAASMEANALVGIGYHQNPEDRGKAIDESRWEGLPQGAQLTYGSLMIMPSDPNIKLPQQFAYQGIKIRSQHFITFEIVSNFSDGNTYNRIIGAIETTGGSVFEPCMIDGTKDDEIIALLNTSELANVKSQKPDRHDGIPAVIVSPTRVYRLNRQSLSIEKVDGTRVTCEGWPSY
jgi:hypothetical protein